MATITPHAWLQWKETPASFKSFDLHCLCGHISRQDVVYFELAKVKCDGCKLWYECKHYDEATETTTLEPEKLSQR